MRIWCIAAAAVGLLTAAIWFGINKAFSLKHVEVVGTNIALVINQEHLPRTILFFPAKKVAGQILASNPLLIAVDIRKKLPHTLVVVARPRQAIARLASGSRSVLLDREGMVLGDATVETLPTLVFDRSPLVPGQIVHDPSVAASLALIEAIKGTLILGKITSYDESSLRAELGKTNIYIAQESDIRAKASTLQTLVEGFRIKGTLPKVVDLRFDKPIITM